MNPVGDSETALARYKELLTNETLIDILKIGKMLVTLEPCYSVMFEITSK
ncbi:MAG: hypothetical protein IJ491_02215 [Clostridia bacterium]|nr:hypothetical protein [Clostridia bacterium]